MALVSIFKAFLFNCSGWMKTVLVHQLNSNCRVKAVVRELRSVKTELKSWVSVFKKTGTLITGHCTCYGRVSLYCTKNIVIVLSHSVME